ncbi:response regulator transcription factor [Bordetella flabilis]|uniref:DNA-binding response regulator n=1 Tax=Bordetella flabilis TaxID=463014 RepID=A0A193G9C9_9BORD|nr:response regulator [Bordetella flabilis]ANN76597.1 DNA-binding response regulator [Bordetella flabilis]
MSKTDGQEEALVVVVDDDDSIRTGLGALFRSLDMRVELFASADDLLAFPFPSVPTCVVLDVRLRGTNGLNVQRQLRGQGVHVPIVFMTGHADIPMTVQAMKDGAADFLTKPFREQDLLDAVAAAHRADRDRRGAESQDVALRRRHASLTPREREVMGMAAAGLMNKQIAAEIGLSEVTVKIHRGNAMRKMGARTFADLVRMAQQLELPAATDSTVPRR